MPQAVWQGKCALITGANKGIGFETARQLGQLGIELFLGARDLERGAAAESTLRSEGILAHAILLDVNHHDDIERAASEIERSKGKLDILVNNAGIHAQRALPSDLELENLRKTIETNFCAAFAVTKRMLPLLLRSDAPRIVNVSSGIGSLSQLADPSWTGRALAAHSMAYSASKAALNVLTVHFANEFAGAPLKINSVSPGFTATDFNQHRGTRKPVDAVKVLVRYATLPVDGPTGGFFDENGPLPW